jgi:orotidine-5'-phosphate decarboxylase
MKYSLINTGKSLPVFGRGILLTGNTNEIYTASIREASWQNLNRIGA